MTIRSKESQVGFFTPGGQFNPDLMDRDNFANENVSQKSPTGPTERTPKPEYLIALTTYLGVRW